MAEISAIERSMVLTKPRKIKLALLSLLGASLAAEEPASGDVRGRCVDACRLQVQGGIFSVNITHCIDLFQLSSLS